MRDRTRILVVGGTGQVGRQVVKALLGQGARVRVLTRDVPRASIAFEGLGLPEDHLQDLEFTHGDLEEHGLLDLLLEESDRAFLLCPASPGMTALSGSFVQAAKGAGLRRLVRLSAAGADPASPIALLRLHGEADAALKASGVPYAILRPHYFMQNILGFAGSIAGHHDFFAPMGEGRVGCVDVRDIGEVAAHLLLHPEQEAPVLTLTGPESLNFREMAAEMSEALGFPVAYIDVAPEDARQAMRSSGISVWMTDAILELMDTFRLGTGDYTTHGVEAILGRRPRTFRAFVQDHAGILSGAASLTR